MREARRNQTRTPGNIVMNHRLLRIREEVRGARRWRGTCVPVSMRGSHGLGGGQQDTGGRRPGGAQEPDPDGDGCSRGAGLVDVGASAFSLKCHLRGEEGVWFWMFYINIYFN